MPFASGLYAVVVVVVTPRRFANDAHIEDVNTDPRSDVMISGRPNLAIQLFNRAETHASVEAFDIGTASGHLVDLSMIVKIYLFPSDWGKGPTTSTCM